MIRRKVSLLLAILMVISTLTVGLMPVTAGSDNGITTDMSAPYDEYEEILRSKEKEQADSDNTEAIQSHRDSLYTKTTDNADGTQTLEVFGAPVKYVAEDGSVRDISLRLIPDGSGFRTEDHYILAEFPEKAGTGISLNTGEYTVTLTPAAEDGTPVETEPALLTDPETVFYRKDSRTGYEYSITYSGYKENIVVSEYTGQTDFFFRLETDGLELFFPDGKTAGTGLALRDADNNVIANLGDVIVFTADDRNNTPGNISYETVTERNEYLLCVSVSGDYLSDPATHYPIRIDPSIEVSYSNNGPGAIEDVTVCSQIVYGGDTTFLFAGKNSAGALHRCFFRFPSLNVSGLDIVSANLYIRDLLCEAQSIPVECHEYTGTTWTESGGLSWANASNGIGQLLDSKSIYYGNGVQGGNWYAFDITSLAEDWADGTASPAKGVLLKSSSAYESGNTYGYKTIGSYNRPQNKPYLTITYNSTMTISQSAISVGIGKSVQLTASAFPSNLNVTWSSSDNSIATVTQEGTVTGMGLGTATITAQCTGSSAVCTVTVIPLSEGIYRVFNWSSLSSLKVDRYGIANWTNVSCSYDLLYDYDNITEKNALWILTHISNNTYTLRPVHKPNLALDCTYSNVDVYGIGIDYSFSLDSTKWKITASSSGGGYIVQNNGLDSKTLALDSSTENIYISNGYTGSPYERWGFIQLSDAEVNSLKGIIVYGSSAVKAGTSSQLTAGVFSPNSLNQSATYYSEFLTGSVTTNGMVTGLSEGKMVIGVTSTVDSSITGAADISIVDRYRQNASLVGIPSNQGGTHDHHSYFSQISSDIQAIYGSTSSISTYTSVSDGVYCKGYICNSDVFVFRGHGTQNSIYFGDDQMYSPIMAISDVSIGGMRIFSDSELVVYCCCLCGSGGKTANNLVVATYKEGAKNVIGFTTPIYCGEANDWLDEFFAILVEQGTIDYAAIDQALEEIEANFVNSSVSRSNILYMYN